MISLGSDIIASLDGQTIPVTRSGGGGYVNGYWVQNSQEEFDITASIQPLNDEEIEFIPEGDRTKAVKKLYTATELKVLDSETSAKADLVEIEGEKYKIIRVQKWHGHFKCLAVRDNQKAYIDQKPGAFVLSALAGDNEVDLSWTASDRANTYTVKRGTSPGAGIITTLQMGITGLAFNDSTAVNGTTYYYKVTAVNAVGNIGSNEVSAEPEAP